MKKLILFVLLLGQVKLFAQENPWRLHSLTTLQGVGHSPRNAEGLQYLSNNYLSTQLRNQYFEAGLRYEYLDKPLPGFDKSQGKGLVNAYLKGYYKGWELSLGDSYEQFGSGILLRLYEDRALGIDNALRGVKLNYRSQQNLQFKFLAGQQRLHFDRIKNLQYLNPNRGYIVGGDLSYQLPLKQQHLELGLSYVGKEVKSLQPILKEDDPKQMLRLPRWVNGVATRLHYITGAWDIFGVYALKGEDPNQGNRYHYGFGSAMMLNLSYARSGLSLQLGLRRAENFDFRASTQVEDNEQRLNHLLPFTQQESYTLAALYPYPTQANGEWSYQGELSYRIPKSVWGAGRYGTKLRLAFSLATSLSPKDRKDLRPLILGGGNQMGTNGLETKFWGLNSVKLYHNLILELSRKVSRNYSLTLGYRNQFYNREVLEGHTLPSKVIKSHIFLYEGKHKLSPKFGLRTELQYLYAAQGERNWYFASAELSILPYFLISLSDLYQEGTAHYPLGSIAFSYKGQRLELGYGKTRAGINCSGGICRYVPATEGLNLSYNLTF